MRSNGLLTWLAGGAGVLLMYAAIKGVTIGSVLAGKPVSAFPIASSSSGPNPLSAAKPFSSSNPIGAPSWSKPEPFSPTNPLGMLPGLTPKGNPIP